MMMMTIIMTTTTTMMVVFLLPFFTVRKYKLYYSGALFPSGESNTLFVENKVIISGFDTQMELCLCNNQLYLTLYRGR